MPAILFQQRAPVTSFRAGDEHSRFFFRAPPMSTNKLLPAWRATSFACPSLCLTFLVQRTKTRKSSSCSRSQQQQKRQLLERACRHESGKYQTLVCTGYFWIGQWQLSASRRGRDYREKGQAFSEQQADTTSQKPGTCTELAYVSVVGRVEWIANRIVGLT